MAKCFKMNRAPFLNFFQSVEVEKIMQVHITNIYGAIGTWVKAQNAVTDIAKKNLHYNELGIYHYPVKADTPEMLRVRLDGILASVSLKDVVIIQSPTWNDFAFDERLIGLLGAYEGLKKVIFIHDVVPLMNEAWKGLLKRYIDHYNQADLIIAPSQVMIDFLRAEGLTVEKTVVQKMWDCVISVDNTVRPQFKKVMNFAGNPNIDSKFTFVKNWKYDDVRLAVTVDEGDWAQGKNVSFLGWFNNESLLVNALRKNGGFGLLWSEVPFWREYMKKNASYKLSVYLAAGIPVIVPSDTAERDTIISKNLGIVVDSLDEAADQVAHMSEETYGEMVESVEQFSCLLRDGYFTKKALTDAVFQLFAN